MCRYAVAWRGTDCDEIDCAREAAVDEADEKTLVEIQRRTNKRRQNLERKRLASPLSASEEIELARLNRIMEVIDELKRGSSYG